ncbi:proto-oncogene tyrosine-protein kinase ros, partial [Lasius niger]
VFEGTIRNLEGSDTTPVAIKKLRENASSQEKEKFLQEAELMSHFCNKHVLKLLGICLDVNSSLIILELMDAGRKRRPATCSLDGTGIFDISNIYITKRCLGIRGANVGNYVIG